MRALLNPSPQPDRTTPAGRAGMVEPDAFLRRSVLAQARLQHENAELRRACDELTTAAETWIRLYEAALARANAAEHVIAELAHRTPSTELAS